MAELADALDSGSNGRKAVQVQVLLPAPKIDKPHMLLVDFISLPTRNRQVSLRLGHAPALTVHRTVIHSRRAAALRVRYRFYQSQGCVGSSPVT